MKTYEQIQKETQERIDKRIKQKDFRQTKTELNINFSWAVNNATNFLKQKDRGTAKGFRLVKKWYPKFIELYREWAMENIPIEKTDQPKLTREDFYQAEKKAPAEQANQEKADEIGEEEQLKEDAKIEEEELAEFASEPK